jgi:hypothetical protein
LHQMAAKCQHRPHENTAICPCDGF